MEFQFPDDVRITGDSWECGVCGGTSFIGTPTGENIGAKALMTQMKCEKCGDGGHLAKPKPKEN